MVECFGGACGICGYNRCHRALAFHHLDESTKIFNLGAKGIPRSWKRLVNEAKKCVMLCHNCHAEVHAGVISIPLDIQRFVEPSKPLPMRRKVVRRVATGRSSSRPKKVPNRPTGKSLRVMVQQTSRVAVAKRFGVSETAVRKWLASDSKKGIY